MAIVKFYWKITDFRISPTFSPEGFREVQSDIRIS
jgi:hypothetical protein